MRLSWRMVGLCLPGVLFACFGGSSNAGGGGGDAGGGCGGGAPTGFSADSNVDAGPGFGGGDRGEPGVAPTGQAWKPVETDEGCGRAGLSYVLVDETCADGEGVTNLAALHAPMFRDGAIVGDHLLTVDATHLWSLDLASPDLKRDALVTGVGQPLAAVRRGNEVLLAAGEEGLVIVDATDPSAPTRSGSLALPGPAFDVAVDGDRAFLALGKAGIAEVDLTTATPSLVRTIGVGGSFAAGVTTHGGHAYVAACGTVKVVDLASGQVGAETWVPSPFLGERLEAPAKKVTVVGDVAFVAAGKYGAVAIDVANPLAPQVLGNCTVDQPSFHASGVRAEGNTLYVAAGEWGVLPIDVTNPRTACATLKTLVPPQEEKGTCTTKPPWEVVPWERIWSPPPPAKDPIQVLPFGDRLYAFGDARRIGTRAIDVRDATTPQIPLVRRYDEPRAILGLAAKGDRLVAVGSRGGVFHVDGGDVVRTGSDPVLAASNSVTILDDGQWVATAADAVSREDGARALLPSGAHQVVPYGPSRLAVAVGSRVLLVDASLGVSDPGIKAGALPLSLLADGSAVVYAAPEWPSAVRLSANGLTALPPHQAFDDAAALDVNRWRARLPRRHLASTTKGIAEIAGLGNVVELALHAQGGTKRLALPTLTYVAATSDGDHVYAVAIDRALYKSYLVAISVTGTAPTLVSFEAFTGAASSVATASGKVFVGDADGAIRIFDVGPSGAATFAKAVAL